MARLDAVRAGPSLFAMVAVSPGEPAEAIGKTEPDDLRAAADG